jgi:hypothetical protein
MDFPEFDMDLASGRTDSKSGVNPCKVPNGSAYLPYSKPPSSR